MTVLDANVIVKWFAPEVGSDVALELLQGKVTLYAPRLAQIEVTGGLLRKFRTDAWSKERTLLAIHEWQQVIRTGAVLLTPNEEEIEQAIKLSLALRHPIQDCLYLALAEKLEVEMITADEPFYKKTSTVFPRVKLLTGCSPN